MAVQNIIDENLNHEPLQVKEKFNENFDHMASESRKIEILYLGFLADENVQAFIKSELYKILDAFPKNSAIFATVTDKESRFTIELVARHQDKELMALGEGDLLAAALSLALQSLRQQLSLWPKDRAVDLLKKDSALEVLLVDDDPISVRLLESCFLQQGCTTHVAMDGAKSTGMIYDNVYDLVVMDWNMPGLDGPQTLKAMDKKLRSGHGDARKKVPVLTYSIYDKERVHFPKLQSFQHLGHLPKSTSYRILRGCIRSFLDQLIHEKKEQKSFLAATMEG